MDKEMTKGCFTILGCFAALAVMLVFGSAISFGFGYLGGMFLKWVCGTSVANGLNMVLGNITQYNFTPNDIPLFTGIMTTIGGFFKVVRYKTND